MAFSGFNIVMAGIGLLSILVIQGVLSSRKNSSLGLFLPATSFIFSIFIIVYFKKFVGDHGFKGYETLGWYGLQFFLANVWIFRFKSTYFPEIQSTAFRRSSACFSGS